MFNTNDDIRIKKRNNQDFLQGFKIYQLISPKKRYNLDQNSWFLKQPKNTFDKKFEKSRNDILSARVQGKEGISRTGNYVVADKKIAVSFLGKPI